MARLLVGPSARLLWLSRLLWLGLVVLALTGNSCRKKSTGNDDSTGVPIGEWSIRLIHGQALVRGTNDTITVRVYGTDGAAKSGILVACVAATGPFVTPNVTTRLDTNFAWWGSTPAVFYWGDGDADNHETINAWAIQTGSGDTLAHTQQSYKVIGG
ncbi:hypothetical protein HZB60_05735 [candidate division KSB1 bacterium]|nr:hypothetical protein [candidate division KSB1 bacterium]